MNLADAHLHRGELAHTASYYRRALFICDSLHLSEHSKFPVYCGLGQTYMDLRDFDLSNHYYELAGQFFDEMTVSESGCILIIGEIITIIRKIIRKPWSICGKQRS